MGLGIRSPHNIVCSSSVESECDKERTKQNKTKAQLLSMCHSNNWKRKKKNIVWCFPLRELNNVKYMYHLKLSVSMKKKLIIMIWNYHLPTCSIGNGPQSIVNALAHGTHMCIVNILA
jgi:hypothetical protein